MPDLGLTRLREQHTRDKAMTSICGECGWPFPCATVRLLDRLAALEEALAEAQRLLFVFADQRPGSLAQMNAAMDLSAALAGTPKP